MKLSKSYKKGGWSSISCQATQRATPRSKNHINYFIAFFLPKCQTIPAELTRQEWKSCKRETGRESVSGTMKTNKKLCVWKYLPFSCLLLSSDIISHVGHQSCSELMTHPAHESFSSFPQPQQGMLGLFLLSSCWSKAVPEPGRICQHQHFDLSLWNR